MTRISAQIGISPSAIRRHVRNHLADELRVRFDTTPADLPTDLAARVLDIADDARRARLVAQQAGSLGLAVRASDAELRALTTLLDRLGVDDAEIFDRLSEGEDLAAAVGAAARSDPAVGRELVAALRKVGRDELADALAAVTTKEAIPTPHRLAAIK